MKLSILVATYGDDRWRELAEERALPSAEAQGCEVLIGHMPDGTRHESRNGLAERATGDYLCFLDADDLLLPGYVEAMQRAETHRYLKTQSDHVLPLALFTPAVSYSKAHHTRLAPAKMLPRRAPDLSDGNCLILGTLVPTDLFLALGGFHEWNARTGNEYDDFDLWIRCLKAGAEIVDVPDAVYVAMQEPDSKHRTADRATCLQWQYEIGSVHFPEIYDAGWIKRHGGRR